MELSNKSYIKANLLIPLKSTNNIKYKARLYRQLIFLFNSINYTSKKDEINDLFYLVKLVIDEKIEMEYMNTSILLNSYAINKINNKDDFYFFYNTSLNLMKIKSIPNEILYTLNKISTERKMDFI